jgi:small-conductance mechanosensitive channel
MQTLGLEIQALLAFGGLSGAAIGLGARDFIANLFGTMMIYLEKPFNIGDEIKFNNLEGRVENITWRSTHLKSNNQKFICLPNAQFLTIAVQNCSRYNDNIVICNITFNTYDQNRAFELLELLAEMLKVQVNSCIYECTYSTNHTVKFKVTIVSQLDNKYLKQIITLEIYKLSQNIAFDLIFEQI